MADEPIFLSVDGYKGDWWLRPDGKRYVVVFRPWAGGEEIIGYVYADRVEWEPGREFVGRHWATALVLDWWQGQLERASMTPKAPVQDVTRGYGVSRR